MVNLNRLANLFLTNHIPAEWHVIGQRKVNQLVKVNHEVNQLVKVNHEQAKPALIVR